MRCPGWVVLMAMSACGPGARSPSPSPDIEPRATAVSAPSPGTFLWTHELGGVDDYWKSEVALNAQGLTALVSVLQLPVDEGGRSMSTVDLVGWDAAGERQWQRRVPGKAPDDSHSFPWNYTVQGRTRGFLVVDGGETSTFGSNVDFGCERLVHPGAADRLLFLDEQGRCERSVGVELFILGAVAHGDETWITRACRGCADSLPPLLRFDGEGAVSSEHVITDDELPSRGLVYDNHSLIGWDDSSLGRRSEDFTVRWQRGLPIVLQAPPVVLPDGQIAVVGRRRQGGFSFGDDILPDGRDLVILRVSAQGDALGAVGTGIPAESSSRSGSAHQLATDASGMVVAHSADETQAASVTALSWKGTVQWTRSLSELVPEGCEPFPTSVSVEPVHGVRVAGLLSARGSTSGVCGTNRRAFVTAFSR